MKPTSPKPRVHFLPVADAKAKLALVAEVATQHFLDGKALLIRCPNEVAAKYIDQHLWAFPPESFLPHGMKQGTSLVRIAFEDIPLPQNCNLLNLAPEPPRELEVFMEIFELLDETSAARSAATAQKRQFYRSAEMGQLVAL